MVRLRQMDPSPLQFLLDPPPTTPLLNEFMQYHDRGGHLSFPVMYRMAMAGIIPRKFLALRNLSFVCPSCLFAQSRRRAWRTKAAPHQLRLPHHTKPGSCVATDQVISAHPGLVPRMDGRHTRDRISCGSVFIDTTTGYSFTHMQTSTDCEQTLLGKAMFERNANSHNVVIRSYHADNGIFAEKAFTDQVRNDNQTITYCGVGAHHQNGIVERKIGLLTRGSRTLLLHAQRRWKSAISTILWPFAWRCFENRTNDLEVGKDGLTPTNRWTQTDIRPDFSQYHTFGCPAFVLDSGLQNKGSQIPRWNPRSRLGIYVGHSPCHAGSVALILNPRTLNVSPQFHVVVDDLFSTVPYLATDDIPPNWSTLVEHSNQPVTDEYFDLAISYLKNFHKDIEVTTVNEEVLVTLEDITIQPSKNIASEEAKDEDSKKDMNMASKEGITNEVEEVPI